MSSLLDVVKELVEAAGVKDAFETAEKFHLRLEQEPYEPLVIESWPASPSYMGEKRHISVAHYAERDGESLADPDILMTNSGYPIEIQQLLGYTRVLSIGANGKTYVNTRAKLDLDDFMALWAENIRSQGWLEVAAKWKIMAEKLYCQAARFASKKAAGEAYLPIQALIFDERNNCDLSAYRIKLNEGWHVIVLGEQPADAINQRIELLLTKGVLVNLRAIRPDAFLFLLNRRAEANKIAPWVELHRETPEE